jgi:hypothetical protein
MMRRHFWETPNILRSWLDNPSEVHHSPQARRAGGKACSLAMSDWIAQQRAGLHRPRNLIAVIRRRRFREKTSNE